jgi:5-hydroxyisourate hydrolase-like protein (transthyretin family)
MRSLRGIMSGAWVLMALAGAAPVSGQVLEGHVLDDETNQPIPGVRVEMLQEGRRSAGNALTDSAGRFAIVATRQGSFRLRAERIGYASATTAEVGVAMRDTVAVVVRLRAGSVLLAPLEVVTRPRRVSNSAPLAEAFERMERGMGGRFITAEQLRVRNPARLTDVMSTMGVTVSGTSVWMNRTRCPPVVVIDGTVVSRIGGNRDAIEYSSINMVDPAHVELIEVYPGVAGMPPEWINVGRCGVIAIWTKRGPAPNTR